MNKFIKSLFFIIISLFPIMVLAKENISIESIKFIYKTEYTEELRSHKFKDLNINTNEDELKRIFNSLDFHNDGKVNYSEFIAATLSSVKFVIKERLISAFQYFDIDNSGFITLDSVIKALIQNNVTIDIEGLKKMFKGKRSKIDFLEFKKIFYEKN